MSNDLKTQTKATQRPTTLNKWKRTVYHEEDPLRLYNTATSPSWYVSDKEKNCVFVLGFVAFSNQKYDIAKKYWELVKRYSPETTVIDPRLPITVHKRLMKACNLKAMAFWPEEKDGIRNKDILLKIQYAEYLILLAKYDEAILFFNEIYKKTHNDHVKAVCVIGINVAISLRSPNYDRGKMASCYEQILKNKSFNKTAIWGKALARRAYVELSRNGMEKTALPYLQRYCRIFPKGRYYRSMKFQEGMCYIALNRMAKARGAYKALALGNDAYANELLKNINNKKKE